MEETNSISSYLWGSKARISYLLVAAALLLLTLLGARELWTQEHRWGDIVSGMFYRRDFLHPYLGMARYYDKPLLSYWFIALFAQLTGSLNTFILRLPSVLAGILAIFAIFRLGTKLRNQTLGFLAGWLLLTTFYFVFWARTSSADMLNMAGTICAVAWYYEKREHAHFLDYTIFFIILALTCLCKGLIGAVVPLLAVFVDIYLHKSWKKHLHWSLVFAALPAIIIYLVPFWASSYFNNEAYRENGLYLVYRENVLRYFKPFDHKDPIYTYFLYLPIYLLPCSLLFIPALIRFKFHFKQLFQHAKWLTTAVLVLLLFLTLGGSRRSYYILPIVPFAILLIADWLMITGIYQKKRSFLAGWIVFFYVFLFFAIDIAPAWYYYQFGVNRFALYLKAQLSDQPWDTWQVVLLDAESKLTFYLHLPPSTRNYDIKANRLAQDQASLLKAWPILLNKPKNTIFITRKLYQPWIQDFFTDYRLIELPRKNPLPFMNTNENNAPIAFVPKR